MTEKQLSFRNNSNNSKHNNYFDRRDSSNNNNINSNSNNMSLSQNNRTSKFHSSSNGIFLPPSRQNSNGGGGGKKKKNHSGNANHLLNVQFERAINTFSSDILPPTSSAKKRNSRTSTTAETQSQFLQANYKFIISPYQQQFDEHLYDPDALISWSHVEEVVVPIIDEVIDCKCPICLDTTILPKISKCGHIMCFTCTLQYLGSEYSKKCPICGEKINRKDLKNVQYTDTAEPQVGKKFTFKLLTCQKGSLQPTLCKEETVYAHGDPPPADVMMMPLCRLPSNEMSENSKFSRVTTASFEYLETMALIEQQRLLELRTECFNIAHDEQCESDSGVFSRGDIEWLPSVTEALALVEGSSPCSSLLVYLICRSYFNIYRYSSYC